MHISDLHIGKVFDKYPEAIRSSLQQARLDSLKNIVDLANKNQADTLVIAGDLFDRINIKKDLVIKTCEILRAFSGLVLTLPGNHDFYSSNEDLWRVFEDNMLDSSVLLKDYRVYDLLDYGIDMLVYPALCDSKHSSTNRLEWIRNSQIDKTRLNIGLGHGAIKGISPDLQGEYFTMSRDDLSSLGLDLWLLGHTHVPYPLSGKSSQERIFNAGTHEPDGMNYRHEGSGFLIDLDKTHIESRRLVTGKYRFEDRYDQVDGSLEAYLAPFKEGYDKSLLRLNLRGYISEEDYSKRNELFKDLEDYVYYLDVRDEGLRTRLTPEKISEKYIHGSFPERMLLKVQADKEVLQLAYDLIEESRDQ